MRKITIGVIGEANAKPKSDSYIKAENLGKVLIDNDYRIINGGMSGIMEAVCKGAKTSTNYSDGMVIGILPSFNPKHSNKYVDVVIPTGLDIYRNAIIANSDAIIAIGGGAGTLSEMAFAWIFRRMILAYDVEGWSGKLAGQRIDSRKRISWKDDRVFKVSNENEVLDTLKLYFHYYDIRHTSIIENALNELLMT